VEESAVAVEAKLQPVLFGNLTQAPSSDIYTHSFAFSLDENGCFPTLPCQLSLALVASGDGLLSAASLLSAPWWHPPQFSCLDL
jgi:hypothetical protein